MIEPGPRCTFSVEMLIAVATTIALLTFGAWRFPESARTDVSAVAVSLVALLLYGAVAAWGRRTSSGNLRIALGAGAKVGLFLGLIEVANHSLEDFADLRSPWPAVLGVSMWALLFLCFGAVGSSAYRRLGSFRFAALGSIWSAMVSTALLVVVACALALLFMTRMQVVLAGEFAASGMSDPRAFVVRNLFDAASSHLLIAPAVAGIVGLFGAVLLLLFRSLSRTSRVVSACVALLLLSAGIVSIRFASSLDRSQRPPYILFGLLALGISLTSAAPLVLIDFQPYGGEDAHASDRSTDR